jgi:hypothetical protein
LFATGTSINSTRINGKYLIDSGTSMAAPHVAGAVALMQQFKKLDTNQTLIPQEIKNKLNLTGVLIDDSAGSGVNFSRIDIFSALIPLDERAPDISERVPADNHITIEQNISFSCSAYDLQLKNFTVRVWNSSSLFYENFANLTGTYNDTQFNITDFVSGNYNWDCVACDTDLCNYSGNFSLTISDIRVNQNYPPNNTKINSNITFSCNSTSLSNLTNISFYLWNSSSLIFNQTDNISGTENTSYFSFNFSQDEEYRWNCVGFNNQSSNDTGNSNYTLTYETQKPEINLSSPADFYSVTFSSIRIYFKFNVSDSNELKNCSLSIGSSLVNNQSYVNKSQENNISSVLTPGTYYWQINCSDEAGNKGNSSVRTVTINTPSTTTGGGGGGGSTSKTYSITEDQIQEGYIQNLKENDQIKFSFSDETHRLKVEEIYSDKATIKIFSEVQLFDISIGEEVRVNLNNDSYYDLAISLYSILYGKANISLKKINEKIVKEIEGGHEEEKEEEEREEDRINPFDEENEEEKQGKNYIPLFVLFFAVLVLIILIVFLIKGKKKSEKKKRKKPKTKLEREKKISENKRKRAGKSRKGNS